MNLEDVAQSLNASSAQIQLAHRVAAFRLERELPLPLSLEDSKAVGLTLLTLQIAAIAYQPEEVAAVTGVQDEDLEVLRSLKPAFFCNEMPAEVAEVAIAA